jgi:hypothetical protein
MPNSMDIMISTGPPMLPPGTRIIAHEKPDQQASWDPHLFDGYFLGPSLDHYICYEVHITKKGTRIVDTMDFFPSKTAMPQTSKDLASIAALELSNELHNPALSILSVTLELPNSRTFTNFQTFSQRPFHQQQHSMYLQCLKNRHSSGIQSFLPLCPCEVPQVKRHLP